MKKNIINISLLSFSLIYLLTSCSTYNYIPNSVSIPMLEEKGETNVAIGLSTGVGADHSGLKAELQTAFAVSPHIGIMINTSHHYLDDALWLSDEKNNRNFIEAGLGYRQLVADHFIFEVYGGVGRSWNSNSKNPNYTRSFIQPSISHKGDFFQAGLAARVSNVHYDKNEKNVAEFPALFLLEPGLTVRFGRGRSALEMTYTHSMYLKAPEFKSTYEEHSFDHLRNTIKIGFVININRRPNRIPRLVY